MDISVRFEITWRRKGLGTHGTLMWFFLKKKMNDEKIVFEELHANSRFFIVHDQVYQICPTLKFFYKNQNLSVVNYLP